MATYNSKHGTSLSLNYLEESRSLMALQGPKAAAVVSRLSGKDLSGLRFMSTTNFAVAGYPCWVSRCGYTGEDGFEISVPHEQFVANAIKSLYPLKFLLTIGLWD